MWATFSVSAQKTIQATEKTPVKLLNNFRLEADLVPLGMLVFGNRQNYSFEAALQPSLLEKYFPVIEVGFAHSENTATNGINYKASGPYARLGFDFNVMKPKPGKKPTNNLFLAGVRLGYSAFSYELNNITVSQDYWGESMTRDFTNIHSDNIWFEIVAGIRVEILPHIYMGWTIRNKNLLANNTLGKFHAPYIPGYGRNKDSNWGVNYAIGYMF
ncbi:MAG: hypothetical protein JXR27_05205 [Paludibacteraceae bacterium]|nr:hypothetical protein [Paludibacteraceae bacterium]